MVIILQELNSDLFIFYVSMCSNLNKSNTLISKKTNSFWENSFFKKE